MNDFIDEAIANAHTLFNERHFPLKRGNMIKGAVKRMFSAHLGAMRSGKPFEAEVLLITGPSGAGKTKETGAVVAAFNESQPLLPNGQPGKIVSCILEREQGWKDLGKGTLHAMRYEIKNASRLTAHDLGRRIKHIAAETGVIGVWYDETQHILAAKKEDTLKHVLDRFKVMVKGEEWPLMLIMTGVPELETYLPQLEQLFRKVTHVKLADIDFATEIYHVHEVVGSYALEARLSVSDELCTEAFLHRLAVAAGFRWGVVFDIVKAAISVAVEDHSQEFTQAHFNEFWVRKTGMHPDATPFTHSRYQSVFHRDHLFQITT